MSPDRNLNGKPEWRPNTDMFVNADGDLILKVEVPGLAKENLELIIQKHCLTITGSRPDPEAGPWHYYVREMGDSFQSIVEVPCQFDLSRAQAAYQNGILRITVPPREIKL